MKTYYRPLFALPLTGGFLLLIAATAGPLAGGRGRPTELLPAPIKAPNPAPDAGWRFSLHDPAAYFCGPDAAALHFTGNNIEGPTLEPRADAAELAPLAAGPLALVLADVAMLLLQFNLAHWLLA